MTYTRNHDGIPVPVDSTTIRRSLSEYPEAGFYGVGHLSVPGVPTDLLTDAAYGSPDYARTYIDNNTVMSFENTDLVITLPTPFDVWQHIAIYTETPNASIPSSSDFSVWPASVCGTWSTYTEYSSTTLTVTEAEPFNEETRTITYPSVSSSPTTTYTLLLPSDPSNSLRYSLLLEDDDGDYTARLNTLHATYIQAKSTQFTDAKVRAPLPTDILDWLATQEEVIKDYPHIKNCWLGPVGEGQPTVHVQVMALTATSSTFLDSLDIYTASTILDASDETGDATATATATNGVTISSNTISSVREAETSSTTHGLGDAIVSGIGGGNADDGDGDANTSDPQSSTDVEAASHATRRSVHVLLGGFCTFAFALALL
jgi:hypothetical protein